MASKKQKAVVPMAKNQAPKQAAETAVQTRSGVPAYPALATKESAQIAIEFIGESGIGVFDLPRMKVPTGGAIAWELQTMKGPEYVKERDVVILATRHGQKAWYREPIEGGGGGKPPDCSSNDGLVGMGKPTLDGKGSTGPHDCLTCVWNQFESTRKQEGGKGKDCKDYAQILACTPEGTIPALITIPPASLKALKKYFVDLMDAGKRPSGVITRLTLQKENGPPPFARVVFTYVEDTAFDREATSALSEALKRALFKVPARQTAAAL